MKSVLRPHQLRAMEELRHAVGVLKRHSPLIMAPTGAGKTILAAAVVDGAMRKGKRVCFTVPAISLIDQTVEAFGREGITEIGVIQADHPLTDWSQPVQIASVQTLSRRVRKPDVDVVVIDEAHRMFEAVNKWIVAPGWEHVPFIGLSATPWAKGMGKYYDHLIEASTTARLIDEGYLSPFRVFAPSHPDLSGVRITAGDYNEEQLSAVMRDAALVSDVVSTWCDKGEDRPTLCFAVDRAHAKALCDQFVASGVPAEYQDAYTEADDRKAIERRFRKGVTRVVCNVGTLTTGVDWDVRCIILARPTRSRMLYVQIIGRGLRTADGKADCLILDHSDTTLRLGFVTDIHGSLDDGKQRSASTREKSEPLPKECASCAFLKPPKTPVCPACGYKAERQPDVAEADGELQELTHGRRPAKSREYTMEEKQSWYSTFIAIGEARGYKSGWASQKYRDKFGVWPHNAMHKRPARVYNEEARRWEHSRRIAWAKSKKRAEQHA